VCAGLCVCVRVCVRACIQYTWILLFVFIHTTKETLEMLQNDMPMQHNCIFYYVWRSLDNVFNVLHIYIAIKNPTTALHK